jgi:hypothetical protein
MSRLANRLRTAAGMTGKPGFPVKRITAGEAKPGMILVGGHRMGVMPDRSGRWPVITEADYQEHGENGERTVYIVADDDPDGCWPAHPTDIIVIAAG